MRLQCILKFGNASPVYIHSSDLYSKIQDPYSSIYSVHPSIHTCIQFIILSSNNCIFQLIYIYLLPVPSICMHPTLSLHCCFWEFYQGLYYLRSRFYHVYRFFECILFLNELYVYINFCNFVFFALIILFGIKNMYTLHLTYVCIRQLFILIVYFVTNFLVMSNGMTSGSVC